MADAAADRDWAHTSAVLAQLYNVQCVRESALKSPDHFNPRKPRKGRRRKFDIEAFKMCVPAYREAQVAHAVREAAAAHAVPVAKPGLVGGGAVPADPGRFIP